MMPSPTNVSVAGESEIHLAPIEPDPNVESGVWLWGVADNLRLAATNAVRIAEELVAKSPIEGSCVTQMRPANGARPAFAVALLAALLAARLGAGLRLPRRGPRRESAVRMEDDRDSGVQERHDALSHRAALHAKP